MSNYNHITKSDYKKFYTVSISYYEAIDQESELDLETEYELIDGIQEVFIGGFVYPEKCVDRLCQQFRVHNPATDDLDDKKIKSSLENKMLIISIADHELSIYGIIHRLITDITVPRKNISIGKGIEIPELLNFVTDVVMGKFGLKVLQPGYLLSFRGSEAGYRTLLLNTIWLNDDEIKSIEAATTTLINHDFNKVNGDYRWDFSKQNEVIKELLDYVDTQEDKSSKGQTPDLQYHYSQDPNYRDFETIKYLDECHQSAVFLKDELDRNIYSNIKIVVKIRSKIINELDVTGRNVTPTININNDEEVGICGPIYPKKSNLKTSTFTHSNIDQASKNVVFNVKFDDNVDIYN